MNQNTRGATVLSIVAEGLRNITLVPTKKSIRPRSCQYEACNWIREKCKTEATAKRGLKCTLPEFPEWNESVSLQVCARVAARFLRVSGAKTLKRPGARNDGADRRPAAVQPSFPTMAGRTGRGIHSSVRAGCSTSANLMSMNETLQHAAIVLSAHTGLPSSASIHESV